MKESHVGSRVLFSGRELSKKALRIKRWNTFNHCRIFQALYFIWKIKYGKRHLIRFLLIYQAARLKKKKKKSFWKRDGGKKLEKRGKKRCDFSLKHRVWYACKCINAIFLHDSLMHFPNKNLIKGRICYCTQFINTLQVL